RRGLAGPGRSACGGTAERTGLEPATVCVPGRYANRYTPAPGFRARTAKGAPAALLRTPSRSGPCQRRTRRGRRDAYALRRAATAPLLTRHGPQFRPFTAFLSWRIAPRW